jgi:hypothetical protein
MLRLCKMNTGMTAMMMSVTAEMALRTYTDVV